MSHYPVTATRADARDNEGFIAVPLETPSWKVGVMSERGPFLQVTEAWVFFSRRGFAAVTFKWKPRNGNWANKWNQKEQKALLRWTAPFRKQHTFSLFMRSCNVMTNAKLKVLSISFGIIDKKNAGTDWWQLMLTKWVGDCAATDAESQSLRLHSLIWATEELCLQAFWIHQLWRCNTRFQHNVSDRLPSWNYLNEFMYKPTVWSFGHLL